jgi:thiol-disulfide isomerase/thioredoxin
MKGPAKLRLPVEGRFPSLVGATGWLNSEPLTPASLRGKIVLVNFWTYTCINWIRTLPYVRAWNQKYRDHGLIVLGAHTPEFAFEQSVDNVRREAKALNVDYPIALDANYGIWEAFANHYWPALYFIDADGQIRHHQFGEGGYERSEIIIQQLLGEAGRSDVPANLVTINAEGVEAAADWDNLRSPETYLGYGRDQSFSSPGGIGRDRIQTYAVPDRLGLNTWALSGRWTIGQTAVALAEPNGRIVFSFHARDVHLVMGPGKAGTTVRFRVMIDGQPPGENRGTDVEADGYGTVTDQRLYQLVRQRGPITGRKFEIDVLDTGLQAFVFTFG